MACKKKNLENSSSPLFSSTREPWRKILYGNKGFPDNYTDKSFLQELKKNVHVNHVTFLEAFLGAGRVTQALCIVVLFCVVFVYMYEEFVDPNTIFFYSSFGTASGYLFYRYQTFLFSSNWNCFVSDFRTVMIFLALGFALSPILKTLTETISTDTIYAMTTFMMFVHLIFFDYGVSAALVSSSLSLNAAIFGSICLASRLASPFHAFVLLTLSVECFVLLPILMVKVGRSVYILTIMILVTILSIWTLSTSLSVVFVLSVTFVNLLCPIWFLKWQSYKDNIYGPWDEAIVKDADILLTDKD